MAKGAEVGGQRSEVGGRGRHSRKTSTRFAADSAASLSAMTTSKRSRQSVFCPERVQQPRAQSRALVGADADGMEGWRSEDGRKSEVSRADAETDYGKW
jgi:hypothetical protein